MYSSPMASSSSLNRRYDVFLSFRGKDVRTTFLSHLLNAFKRKGIDSFIDEKIRKSLTIGHVLTGAIRDSMIAIVVFSENYASSGWCLDELVEIVKCRDENGLIVIPIFYGVDPCDVRNQIGNFGKGFQTSCGRKTEEEEQRRRWKQALKEVADVAGEHSDNWKSEADMMDHIASDVFNKLNATPSRDFDDFVGIEDHVARMMSLLCLEDSAVRMVGILGPAGIGKTTIARVLYNRLSAAFQLSLFENVRESYIAFLDDYVSKLHLQGQFLSKIFNEKGIRMDHLGVMKERLKHKKVLMVLDDVNKLQQLQALTDDPQWFGPGSRIIVTTKDEAILRGHKINLVFKVELPSEADALKIFCLSAFKQNSPPVNFKKLAVGVIELSGRLPLALRVMGSHMHGKSNNINMWAHDLGWFRDHLLGDIKRVLRVSYDDLQKNEKDIYLHIACFFSSGARIDYLTDMLAKRGLNASLQILADKSLIQISCDEEITMHHLLQQVGRDVVLEQSGEPGKRQFLLDSHEICDVLARENGTETLLGISLDTSEMFKHNEVYISKRAFERMRSLLFLRIICRKTKKVGLHLPGLDYLPPLRLLHWEEYPLKCIPSGFRADNLVELRMEDSKLERLWEGRQPLRSLKLLDLSGSLNLKEIPDLSSATDLYRLDLDSCTSLVTLPSSIGNLHKLVYLNMSGCSKLETLPTNVNLKSLSWVDLSRCQRLRSFPEISESIETLNLQETAIQEVPSSVRILKLRTLDMSGSDIKRFSDPILCFPGLAYLYLSNCRKLKMVGELPGNLSNLCANNCDSLQMTSSLFHDPVAHVEFANSWLLWETTTQEVPPSPSVLQRNSGIAILPGIEVPPYFRYRATGTFLPVRFDLRHPFGCLGFKACILVDTYHGFFPEHEFIRCRLIGKSGVLIKTYMWSLASSRASFESPHLFILCYAPLKTDKDPQADVMYKNKKILFEFSFWPDHLNYVRIIKCGVQLFDYSSNDESVSRRNEAKLTTT